MTSFRNLALTSAAVGLFSASSALAQDAQLCGGIGADGQWLGGAEEASDISTFDGAVDLLSLVPRGGQAVTLLSVSQPTEVRLEARGQGGGDPVIELVDANGNYVTSDDDSGGDRASRAEVFLDPGQYCLQTSSFGGGIMMAEIRVGRTEHEPLTAGNISSGPASCTADTPAVELVTGSLESALGQPVTVVGSAIDQPFYRFTLNEPTPISITADNQSADPVLSLYDGQGALLAENDDFTGLNSRIDFQDPLAAGTYCIGISALSDETAPITVEVIRYDEQAVLEATYATAETAPPLDGSYPVENLGEVSTRLRKDVRVGDTAVWFQFQTSEGGLILIEGIGDSRADPVLTLFDDLGRPVTRNDDYGDSLDSLIANRLLPGTYIIAVSQYSGDSEGTIRLVMERFVPAQ